MLLNTRFGDYTLLKKIAKGGMAEVYLAVKRGPNGFRKIVALKTITGQRSDDASFARLFFNEAKVASRFNHPNLISVNNLTQIDGRVAMEMEYLPGCTVAELVQKASSRNVPFTREAALRIAMEACLGLYHAHHLVDWDGTPLDLVHRDLSPQNILIGHSGQVKVFDFGIAKAAGQASTENLAGVLAGKYAYMSPEQTQGGELDERSDVFSLGIILWELTTQHRLFKRANQIEVLRAVTEEEIPKPSSVATDYPPRLEEIVMSALERDPARRPGNAMLVCESLQKYVNQSGDSLSLADLSDFVTKVFASEVKSSQQFFREVFKKLERDDEPVFPAALPQAEAEGEPDETTNPDLEESAASLRELAALTARGGDQPEVDRNVMAGLVAPLPDDIMRDLNRSRTINIILAVVLVLLVIGSMTTFLVVSISSRKGDSEVSLPVGMGELTIESEPAGATIFLNDVQRAESTPANIRVPLAQELTVRLSLQGHEDVQVVVRLDEPQRTRHFSLLLPQRQETLASNGAIRVVTAPFEAAVFVNGVYNGLSPATIDGLGVGVGHHLRVQKQGYVTREIEFTLTSSRLREFELELVEAVELGILSLRSTPDGARVIIDGTTVGVTPMEGLPLVASREFDIELELEGYRSYQTTVNLQANIERVIDHRFSRPRERSPGVPSEEQEPERPVRPGLVPIEEVPVEHDPYELI